MGLNDVDGVGSNESLLTPSFDPVKSSWSGRHLTNANELVVFASQALTSLDPVVCSSESWHVLSLVIRLFWLLVL
jgi:hypothetical protein